MNNEPDYNNLYFERTNTMTQRIFDVENEKDMADLWNILPDMVKRIEKDDVDSSETTIPYNRYMGSDYCIGGCPYIAINWRDKTEITRPIQEATDADIGKLCLFWGKGQRNAYGVLESVTRMKNGGYDYQSTENRLYSHCRRLTKQEIKELC